MFVAAVNTPITTRRNCGLRQQLGDDVVAELPTYKRVWTKNRALTRTQFGGRLEQSVVLGEDVEAA